LSIEQIFHTLRRFSTLVVNKDQLSYAKRLIETYNFDKERSRKTNDEMKVTGVVGEITICDALGLPRPVGYDRKGDGGCDLIIAGKRINIKTNRRARYPTSKDEGDIILYQKRQPVDYYLFCSLHKHQNISTLCGLCEKKYFWENGILREKGQELNIKGVRFLAHQTGLWMQYKKMFSFIGGSQNG